jgi:hypothetical protein
LDRLPAWQRYRIRQPEIRNGQPAKIYVSSVIQFENLLLPGPQLNQADVPAQCITPAP